MRVEVKHGELKKLYEKLTSVDMEKACSNYINDCLKMAQEKAQNNTQVVTGTLKNGWQVEKQSSYKGVLYNPVEYALFYEYGHKTSRGNWVVGRFPMTKAKNKVKRNSDKIAKRSIERVILK